MILMNDFKAEPAELLCEEIRAVERVIKSGWFILGKEVEVFETAWAKFCGTKFAVGVGNGMDAIEIGLRALQIGEGDEVITTPMTALATVLAIVRSGATPVLADIDPETALLDRASVERCISPRTRAVLLVHLYGQARELDQWQAFCRARQIHLLEDCAQAHGAKWNGQVVGGFGDFGAYSFYPTKNLGARGDGGAIVTNSEEIANAARILRNYGQQGRYRHAAQGLNSRLDELQAAILSVRLQWLKKFNSRRVEVGMRFLEGIRNPRLRLLSPPAQRDSHVFHLFVVRSAERDRLSEYLKEQGIGTLAHYPVAAHQQPCFAGHQLASLKLPVAEQHARECLSIPCHPQIDEDQVEKIIRVLNSFGT